MSLFSYQFDHPWILYLLLAILPVYLFLTIRARRRTLIPYPPIQYKPGRFSHKLVFAFNTLLESLLIIIIILSLAKPYRSTELISIEETGLDIILVVDVSASMQAKDFDPNRLEATKKIIKDFVRRSGGHRIAVVVFAKHVFTLSPPTTDHLVLQKLIDGLSFQTIDHYMSGGTAIGDAILRAADTARHIKIPGRDQVMILLTDGDSNAGIENDLATRFAVDNEIKIYTIGLGSTEEITVKPTTDDPDWSFTTRLVEEPLQKIAKQAGGIYFHASNNTVLNEIFRDIAKLEQTPLEIDQIHQKKFYRYPLNIAVSLLFILALLIRTSLIRRPLK